MDKRRRYEVLLPLRFQDGSDVPIDLVVSTQREIQYACGLAPVASHIWQHSDRQTGDRQDHLVRLVVDLPDTPENLAFFYKLKHELRESFRKEDVRITSFEVCLI